MASKFTEDTLIPVSVAGVIGGVIFAVGIAYAKIERHDVEIVEIKSDRKERIKYTDEKIDRLEKLTYRMAVKMKVRTDDLNFDLEE